MDTSALSAFAVASSILVAHLFGLAFVTIGTRVKSKKWVNAEDARVNKGELTDVDHPEVLRVHRTHINALENALPFFVIGALYVATGGGKTGAYVFFGTFVLARLLHSAFYLKAVQPLRSLAFVTGVLATLGMIVQIVRASV